MFDKYEAILHPNDVETMLHYLFDFFSSDELEAFLTHIKMEKGIEESDQEELETDAGICEYMQHCREEE